MKLYLIYILKRTPFHLLFWFLVWYFFMIFFSVGSQNKEFTFSFSSILAITTIISSYVVVYYLIPNYLLKKRYLLFGLYTVYLLIVILFVTEITVIIGFTYYFNLDYQIMPNLTKSFPVMIVCISLIVSLASAIKLIRYNYKTLEKNKTLENKFLETQLQLKEQELRLLKMQIHPHFLFNSLNTIYGYALQKEDKAPEMILKLSNLLDYILYQIEKPAVLLTNELNHVQDYIDLEKMRFHDALQVTFHQENISDVIMISPMLLIPFVENSFKHGAIVDGVLSVAIDVSIKENNLIFRIVNSVKKNEDSSSGIGLENIKKRLEMLYQDRYELTIQQKESQFIVGLIINLKP